MRKRGHNLWPMAALCMIGIVAAIGNGRLIAQLSSAPGKNEPRYPILAACSGRDSDLFTVTEAWLKDGGRARMEEILGQPDVGEPAEEPEEQKNAVELWRDQYHAVVEAVIASAEGIAQEPDCLAEDLMPKPEAGGALLNLAKHLEPWKEEEALLQLTMDDMWVVLLEYLREYECALVERYFYLFSDVIAEHGVRTGSAAFHWHQIFEAYYKQYPLIRSELQSARPALHRAITVLNGEPGMRRLAMEMRCLHRASKDIRNALALGAEAAACFPRIQDAKDPLRDMEPLLITR